MAQTGRITKEELKEDKFVAFVTDAYHFIRTHAKILIAAAVAVVIVLAAVSLYFYQREQSAQAASLKMGKGLQAFTEAESNWLDPEKHEESLKKFEEARDYFQDVFQHHGSSSYTDKALFYHAKALAYLKDYDGALSSLQRLVAKFPDSLFALHAQLLIGQIHAQKGGETDLQQAVEALAPEQFTRFARLPLHEREQVQMLAQLERGRYFERLNRPEEALKAYEQILQTFDANLKQAIIQRSRELIQSRRKLLETIQADLEGVEAPIREAFERAKTAEAQGDYLEALKQFLEGVHLYRLTKEDHKRLDEPLRQQILKFEKGVAPFLKGIKDARERFEEGRLTSALYNYEQALGGLAFAPSRSIYEKAHARANRLRALLEPSEPAAQAVLNPEETDAAVQQKTP